MAPAIEFQNVVKKYRIGQWLPSIREALSSSNDKHPESFHMAVNDVSFSLDPGESIGIIGPNGAGKTTILKLLSGVTHPTTGHIKVNGRFSALIELGAGFHPDLSGRENVYLNGTILGMKRHEINERFDDIVEFSGISKFLDTPVKRYSSGMYARLGFAIAAHIDPDVLIVDEVLAVGDYAFQQKCYARMDELRRDRGTSLIFVSHNMDVVRRVCDRGLVMYRGNNIFQGTAAEAVIAYSDAVRQAAREATIKVVPTEGGLSERVMTFDAEIMKVTLYNADKEPTTTVQTGEKAYVKVEALFHKAAKAPIFSFTIRTVDGRMVYDTTTRWRKMVTPDFEAGELATIEYELDMSLLDGEYDLGVDIASTDFSHYFDRMERAMGFWVQSPEGAQGLTDLRAKITIEKNVQPSKSIPPVEQPRELVAG